MVNLVTSDDALKAFGPPEKEGSMILWNVPDELAIPTVPRRIYCNKLMPPALTLAFANLLNRGIADQLKTWDGCFNIRAKKGGHTKSLHAWGLAIDVNASANAFGAKPTLTPEFIACFEDAGFDSGARWTKPDGMHFQLASLAPITKVPSVAVSRPSTWLDLPTISPPYPDTAATKAAYLLFGKPVDLGDAIKAFQGSKGLVADGQIGPKTWPLLLDKK